MRKVDEVRVWGLMMRFSFGFMGGVRFRIDKALRLRVWGLSIRFRVQGLWDVYGLGFRRFKV